MYNEKEMTLNELLAKEAETHDSHIQFLLGRYYEEQEDYENSFKWCKLAANQGDSDAQYKIGVMYYNGEVVEQDYEEAFKWCNLQRIKITHLHKPLLVLCITMVKA